MFYVKPTDSESFTAFEFNCIGTINASRRTPGATSVQAMSDGEISAISVLPSCGNRPFREIEGLFTWDLLAAIPLSLIGVRYEGTPVELRGNFYKCASGTSQPHFLSWEPVKALQPDFNRPDSFGRIILE